MKRCVGVHIKTLPVLKTLRLNFVDDCTYTYTTIRYISVCIDLGFLHVTKIVINVGLT